MIQTLYHVTPISKLESIMENGLIPQIGERSEQVEEEPGIFLFPTYQECETALYSWLGEEFDDLDEEVVSLKVELPADFPLESDVEWERCSRQPIAPEYITFHKHEG